MGPLLAAVRLRQLEQRELAPRLQEPGRAELRLQRRERQVPEPRRLRQVLLRVQ